MGKRKLAPFLPPSLARTLFIALFIALFNALFNARHIGSYVNPCKRTRAFRARVLLFSLLSHNSFRCFCKSFNAFAIIFASFYS
jgi:hypothetical protein